jgi:hypothetical protein
MKRLTALDVAACTASRIEARATPHGGGEPSMDHIGIEVHAEESQIRILGEAGELRERRIRATPNGSPSPLGIGREPASSLGSTESEWVARC